jgi:AAA domain-containing protein
MGCSDAASDEPSVLMPAGFAISFSGRIASGKTTITQSLAEMLGWPRAGFSDYLRFILKERGNNAPTREQLQDLGQSLVTADPDQFCRNVLGLGGFVPGGNILLDGIRHVDIQRRIASLVEPSRAILIHLAADDELVERRTEQRGASEEEFKRASSHPVEQDLQQSLPSIADYSIDASHALPIVISDCLEALEKAGVDQDTLAHAWAALAEIRAAGT